MSPFLVRYVVGWITFSVVALIVGAQSVRVHWREALAFVTVPWKVALFVPAIAFVTFAGSFTNDETWDVVSGGGMSVLTVATAWWSVGTAVKIFRRKRPLRDAIVVIGVTLFASSWFYDGYLLLRDGAYTPRWLGNLMLSPTIYLCAGLVANLEVDTAGKLAFAFAREDWPRPLPSKRVSWALAAVAMPLVVIAAYFLVGFVGWRLPSFAR